MSRYEIERRSLHSHDERLYSELRPLAASAFVDPDVVLGRAMRTCNRVYILRDHTQERSAIAFFLTHLKLLENPLFRGDVPINALLYLGLSGTRADTRASGLVIRVYKAGLVDACDWEAATGKRLLAWGRTVNPTVMRSVRVALCDVAPTPDWSYTPDDANIARALRMEAGLPTADPAPANPFHVIGAFPNDRFVPSELERMDAIRQRDPNALPVSLRADHYDQLLFFGFIRKE